MNEDGKSKNIYDGYMEKNFPNDSFQLSINVV